MTTEDQAVVSVLAGQLQHGRRGLSIPRYTPNGWWECDLAHLTNSGYLVEYEVKVSRADFKKDTKKCRERYGRRIRAPGTPADSVMTKYGQLEVGDPRGPCRFWYVTPAGLLSIDELPPWAGLIELGAVYSAKYPYHRTRVIRQPKQLHRKRLSEDVVGHMRGICYYRMLSYLFKYGGGPVDDD